MSSKDRDMVLLIGDDNIDDVPLLSRPLSHLFQSNVVIGDERIRADGSEILRQSLSSSLHLGSNALRESIFNEEDHKRHEENDQKR